MSDEQRPKRNRGISLEVPRDLWKALGRRAVKLRRSSRDEAVYTLEESLIASGDYVREDGS